MRSIVRASAIAALVVMGIAAAAWSEPSRAIRDFLAEAAAVPSEPVAAAAVAGATDLQYAAVTQVSAVAKTKCRRSPWEGCSNATRDRNGCVHGIICGRESYDEKPRCTCTPAPWWENGP
ncbi:MAG: hypothetical protein HY078_03995 [Elusimicrobia bacterium]|nr:hypothetical protein [Elusimicrobiota bacterium]